MITIVVGGGLAGLVSALKASETSKVYLFDKEKIGGNSAKATSGINGCMTKWQSEQDSYELFETDVIESGKNESDYDLVHTLVRDSPMAIAIQLPAASIMVVPLIATAPATSKT